jgi:hypothetical protein
MVLRLASFLRTCQEGKLFPVLESDEDSKAETYKKPGIVSVDLIAFAEL